ncbi:HAD-IIIA family hydrolase [Actinomadura gamaensis]|uniref:D,D-heptose 1,7-bisphosphate phosphatase n=1 Tax=Actinomadura gamaensis TaxID=1763541 RepID=A0ABV9TUS3_9ACTN
MKYSVVIPTVGRDSLRVTLEALLGSSGPPPAEILVVDDRPEPGAPLPLPDGADRRVRVLRSGGRGPAAARNTGWHAATSEWIVFLDDDVVPDPDWAQRLTDDLAGLPGTVGGSQGRVVVPLPQDRRPTDWERNTAGLATSVWITADMAYRRPVLTLVGGFDERFRRAFREDADLALRVQVAGHELVLGRRRIVHPVRPAGFWASVKAQAGNADDALMNALHGRGWYARVAAPRGRFAAHVATTAAGALALAALAPWERLLEHHEPQRRGMRRGGLQHLRLQRHAVSPRGGRLGGGPRHRGRGAGAVHAARRGTLVAAGTVWAGLTAQFAAARIRPGPKTPGEILRMAVTSAVIPPVAVAHRVRGTIRHRDARVWRPRPVVLFDRDDTLIRDVPYNGDPELVEPVPGARAALERLRRAGLSIGVITNQSGVARGKITETDVRRVNRRVEDLLGRFDVWEVCPHGEDDGCACRKPAPGMVERAARRLGVAPSDCVVIGDIGADVAAARAAGARGVLVPTDRTKPGEIDAAPEVAPDLAAAVDLVLLGGWAR